MLKRTGLKVVAFSFPRSLFTSNYFFSFPRAGFEMMRAEFWPLRTQKRPNSHEKGEKGESNPISAFIALQCPFVLIMLIPMFLLFLPPATTSLFNQTSGDNGDTTFANKSARNLNEKLKDRCVKDFIDSPRPPASGPLRGLWAPMTCIPVCLKWKMNIC